MPTFVGETTNNKDDILKRILRAVLHPLQIRGNEINQYTMKAKVSVIVPVYNMEKYLWQCLDSLVDQTLKEIEIICSNDASTDSSLEILQEYAAKDSRVKIIDSKANIKQGGGRNAGIPMAEADSVMSVDSDDWVALDFVESH